MTVNSVIFPDFSCHNLYPAILSQRSKVLDNYVLNFLPKRFRKLILKTKN